MILLREYLVPNVITLSLLQSYQNTTPTSDVALQRKLQHLQNEHTNTHHSNVSTPTLTLEPWASVQQRVYDARNGSF